MIDNQKTSITYEPESEKIIIIHPDLGGVHVISEKSPSPIHEEDQRLYGSEVAARMAGVEPPTEDDLDRLRARLRLAGLDQRERDAYQGAKADITKNLKNFDSETGRRSGPTNVDLP